MFDGSCKRSLELFLKEIEEGKDNRFDARLADPTGHGSVLFAALIAAATDLFQLFQIGF